jgi:uncharacterized protein YggT (Ycf19 family)
MYNYSDYIVQCIFYFWKYSYTTSLIGQHLVLTNKNGNNIQYMLYFLMEMAKHIFRHVCYTCQLLIFSFLCYVTVIMA